MNRFYLITEEKLLELLNAAKAGEEPEMLVMEFYSNGKQEVVRDARGEPGEIRYDGSGS